VTPYYARFLDRWPTVQSLASASLEDVLRAWAGLGYYARARNLHACAREVVARHDGIFPRELETLRALPGVGDYTAAAIVAIAFDAAVVPVDGNVERVVTRLFAVEEPLPAAKPRIKRLAASMLPAKRAGDFAQALMDLGATICSPKRPACALCPWNEACVAHACGDEETFPRKVPKREGKLRRGAAFVALRDGAQVLLRRRAEKGLLGGMSEVPGSEWSHNFDMTKVLDAAPRFRPKPDWRRLPGAVDHVFTHFPLRLTVFLGHVGRKTPAPAGTRWERIADLPGEALPNVMRKVIAHALEDGTIKRRQAGGRNAR
jgi:A/G-specific adenine glycosylase